MNKCPFCGFQNPADIHICLGCASSLKRQCPNCGAEVLISNRFCGQCGKRLEVESEDSQTQSSLSSETSLQERMLLDLRSKMPSSLVRKFTQASKELYGQRREVTVLIVEIADYLSISKTLDSERIYMAVDEIVHLLANVVYKYEGTIDKYTGSGLMALFGIPLNHENDPERAVRAALEMQHNMAQLRDHLMDQYQHDFKIQIGINTGSVIAGSFGDQHHMEYTVVGDTVQLASQLQSTADAGTVMVSFRTYQRSHPIFDYQSLPPLNLEGIAEPVKVFQPLNVRLKSGQVRGLPGLQVPMIGRSEQLEKLVDIFQEVISTDTSHIVCCSGEAGIGKSRLIAEFRNYLASYPVTMVQGTCASYMRITPYRVVADVLRNMLAISELDPTSEQRKALRRRLEQLGLDRDDILPYLMHVLGLLQSDPVMDVRIKLLEPSMLRRQTHFALRMFFIAESRQLPLVLVFDDLHWVDQASGHFLEYICQSLEDFPLILIMVARDFGKFGLAQSIRAAANKHIRKPYELHIQPLSISDTHLLVDQLVHEDTPAAQELKNLITARAGGNPYYTEELVRILIDHGGLEIQDEKWHVTDKATKIIQEVPGTLSDIILARFDHLPDLLKQVLLKASILGDSFSIRLLQALIKNDFELITDALMELDERDFLIHAKFDIEEGYIFKHPLLQETIYKTVLKRDLRKLHSQVAQAIETGDYWLPGERNQVLAYHLSEGINPEEAIPYLLISAEEAYQHFANDTVVQLYRHALSLMETSAEAYIHKKEQAMVGLAQALKFTGELEEAAHVLVEIVDQIPQKAIDQPSTDSSLFQTRIEALRELADIRAREGNLDFAVQLLKQGMDLLGESGRNTSPNIWRRLADRLAWVYFRQSNLEEAYNLVDLALLDTPTWEAEDPITMASLYNTIGGIYWTRSRFAEAIESVDHSLEIYRNLHYHWGIANALTNLGILHFSTGKWSQAVDYLEQADRMREEYGDDPERPGNLSNLGEVLIDMGEYQRALSKLETSREISQRLGLDFAQVYAENGLCRLSIFEGDLPKAKDHLERVKTLIESLDEINDRVAHYYQLEALIKIEENDFQSAKESAENALSIAKQGGMTDKQVDALRILGTVNVKTGYFEQAESYLMNSIELAQKLSDRFSEAKARYELGFLFWHLCESDPSKQSEYLKQAERSLDAAIGIFEELGAKHDLQRAKSARALFTSAEVSGKFFEDKAEIEKQMDMLQTRLSQVDGGLYQATIFAVGLTPRQGMDEELIFETITFLIQPITDLIHENGGKVIHNKDGITAIFGGPVTHEDDPERAVDTVMQIINYYNELNQQTELSVSIHIGITMGEIVGGEIDLEQTTEFMAIGEPVQLARVVADACPTGRVWVTESVRNLTSFRFEYESISPSLAEGLSEHSIFQLEGLREQMLPVRGLIGLKSPFIGRNKELDAMHNMSLVLDGDTGGIIWVEGDAGIGKSRLLREFSNQLFRRGALVLSGACTARRSDYAFSLFTDLLLQTFDIQHNFSPNQINAHINQKLNLLSPELMDTRPFLQLLLGVQPSGAQGEQITAMEPEQLRQQTFVAIHRLMSSLASSQPLVLILDDLQWIDSISADLLLYLSHQIVSQRVLLVCAQRQKEISPFEQILARTRSMHPEKLIHLFIKPLTITECYQLLSEFLSTADLPDSIISLIVQQSGGNPYYIEEFVRLLVEKDFLRLVKGKLLANRTINIDALEVPTSLESLIRARVDSLERPAKQLLQVASVIGPRTSQALLAQVAERDEIDMILAVLHTRGMLNPTSEEGHWEFSHPLIEVIVYNNVLRAQRRILHYRTATALEEQWQGSEGEHAEDLAYHFGKAEIHTKALHYLILAGERAAARHANDVAVSYFEQAAELISAVPDVSDESRWRIIRGMGEVYQFIGKYDSSLTVLQSGKDLLNSTILSPAQRAGIYRRMGDTAHKKGDQDQAIYFLQQALDVIGEPDDLQSQAEAALIYARLGWCQFMQSDLENAKKAVITARKYAGEANSLTTLAMTENHLGGILFRQGDLQQAIQHTRTAMDYWQEIGYSWGFAAALSNLGILESASGNWQAAFNSIKRSLELRQKMGDVDGVAITSHNLGQIARNQGDVLQAEHYYRDSLAVSIPFQMNWHAANSFAGLAQSLLYQGKIGDASEALRDCFRLAEEINAPDVIYEAHCTSAEIFLAQEDFEESERSARNAIELAMEIDVGTLRATAWRLLSDSLLRQQRTVEACQALQKAWQAVKGGSDDIENGRLHVQSMLVAKATGDHDQAQTHCESAERIFKQLGASRDLVLLESIEL
jgi:predicted ATPase/class 3 adenylate cyclase